MFRWDGHRNTPLPESVRGGRMAPATPLHPPLFLSTELMYTTSTQWHKNSQCSPTLLIYRNIFKTSLYIYIFQDEKCRLMYLYLWSLNLESCNIRSDRKTNLFNSKQIIQILQPIISIFDATVYSLHSIVFFIYSMQC